MGWPLANEYYKLRTKDGRDRIFKTPQELADACNAYFQFCQENPFIEIDYRGKDAVQVDLPKWRVFSIEGLCNYIDIARSTFQEYEKREDFSAVTTRAKQIIEAQQFEGATAGFLNPNIIARKLGLSEKTENTHSTPPDREINIIVNGTKSKLLNETN